MVGTFLPESGAVEIWLCDAIESESGDLDEEFETEEVEDCFRELPLPWDGC